MYPLYFGVLPSILLTLIFSYLPMFTNVIAFMDYDMFNGWLGLGSPFVGFQNFSFLKDPDFYKLVTRTLTYSVAGLIFSFPASLLLALALNELRNELFKRTIQTISYIPHFVSWVTVASLVYIFLSVDPSGLINNLKQAMVGGERISFMQKPEYFLAILLITGVWKEIGWGTIIYLASITSIDPQLYEAAQIDGAGRWKQMLHVTLPGIMPATVILLIFAVGGLFSSNFDQIYNLQNDVIRNDVSTINLYVYYKGLRDQQYSLSTAIGLFQGVISFILIRTANFISKKVADVGFL